MADRVGQQLGNYQLTRLLGQGGFAEVYLAEHLHLKTQAAVKLLYGKLTTQDIQAFTHEAQTIAALKHPHILRVLDFGFDQALPFLVMDYAPGGTLRDRYPSGSRVPLSTVLSFVKQVSSALSYAHQQKLIHRDVKPENMLIDATNTLLLSDFGIVTVAHSTASMKTIDNSGTVHYMAPEQIKGNPRPASDQYALAIVVYEWLCGERPFLGDTAIEIAMRQLSDNPPSLLQKVPSLSPTIEQVIFKALAKDPKYRFADILEFSNALEQAYEGKISNSRPSLFNSFKHFFSAKTAYPSSSSLPPTQPASPPSSLPSTPPVSPPNMGQNSFPSSNVSSVLPPTQPMSPSNVSQNSSPSSNIPSLLSPTQPASPLNISQNSSPSSNISSPFSGPPTAILIVSEQGHGDYTSINEAIKHAQPHSRILVRPGTYVERVILDKEVEIVGDGPREHIFLENHDGGSLIIGTEHALVHGITIRSSSYYNSAVTIQQGKLSLIDCEISSTGRHPATISIAGKGTNALIKNCSIYGKELAAVDISDYGQCVIENCTIMSKNSWAVRISKGGAPVICRCKITAEAYGVLVTDYGRGTIEECDLTKGNSLGAFSIEEGCQVILRNNLEDGSKRRYNDSSSIFLDLSKEFDDLFKD